MTREKIKAGAVREPKDARALLCEGETHPYHFHLRAPFNDHPAEDGERAALGVLAELRNRQIIGETLEAVDPQTRAEIVSGIAGVIREIYSRRR